MSLHDFESSCHFYFKNSWNVSILTKLRHRFFLKYDEKILYNYNYVDFPLYIESAGNGSCHWVYVYIHVLLITKSEYWCIDLARSVHQGLSLRFPCNDQTDKVNIYLLNGLFIMDLSLQSIKTNNWPADNFKKTHHLNELYFWAVIQSGDTGQQMPFLTAVNWP